MTYVIAKDGVDKLAAALRTAKYRDDYTIALRSLAISCITELLRPIIRVEYDGLPDRSVTLLLLGLFRSYMEDILVIGLHESMDFYTSIRCADGPKEAALVIEYLLSGGGKDEAETVARLLPRYETHVTDFLKRLDIQLSVDDLVKLENDIATP